MSRITPCLWFDHQAEEAAQFYGSLVENSRIDRISRYGKEGFDIHGQPGRQGAAVAFQLAGQDLLALNGGRISDSPRPYRSSLSWRAQCGWLKDRFGVS